MTQMITEKLNQDQQWEKLLSQLEKIFGKKPEDLRSILFLIGVQELGMGIRKFSKEEKRDLMHIAICKVLSYSGYYEEEGIDEDGWPHWKLIKILPANDMLQQDVLLKNHILKYFEENMKL